MHCAHTNNPVAAALGIKPYPSYAGDPREDLIKKKVNGDNGNNIFLQHGIDNEPAAIAKLEQVAGIKVYECGLFVHPTHTWLGGWTDALWLLH